MKENMTQEQAKYLADVAEAFAEAGRLQREGRERLHRLTYPGGCSFNDCKVCYGKPLPQWAVNIAAALNPKP